MPNDPTLTAIQGGVTILFYGTWIALMIVSVLLFYVGKDAALKRLWWPRFVVLAGVLLVGYMTTITVLGSPRWESLAILVFLVPAVTLISYLNIRLTKFCDQCGSRQFNANWFSPRRFCSRCGAALDDKPRNCDDPWE